MMHVGHVVVFAAQHIPYWLMVVEQYIAFNVISIFG